MDIYKRSIASRLAEARTLAEHVVSGDLDPVDGCLSISQMCSGIEPEGLQIYELWKGIVSQLWDLPQEESLSDASAEFKSRVLAEKEEYRVLFGSQIRKQCEKVIQICQARGRNPDEE